VRSLGEDARDGIVDLAARGEILPSGFSSARRVPSPARPAISSPAIVGSNKEGAVDRKIASPARTRPHGIADRAERFGRRGVGTDIMEPRQEAVAYFGRSSLRSVTMPSIALAAVSRKPSSPISPRAVP
jgi:hypothetical protein